LKAYVSQAKKEGVYIRQNITSHVATSTAKFCCQISFEISLEPCVVVDMRDSNEVISQIRRFIHSGNADDCWI